MKAVIAITLLILSVAANAGLFSNKAAHEAAVRLLETAGICLYDVRDDHRHYGRSRACMDIDLINDEFFDASGWKEKGGEIELNYVKAQRTAWIAVALSNALYPKDTRNSI